MGTYTWNILYYAKDVVGDQDMWKKTIISNLWNQSEKKNVTCEYACFGTREAISWLCGILYPLARPVVWLDHCYLPYLHLWVKSGISFLYYLEILGLCCGLFLGLSPSQVSIDFCVWGFMAFRVQRWKDSVFAFKELIFYWRADTLTDDNHAVWQGCEEKIVSSSGKGATLLGGSSCTSTGEYKLLTECFPKD